MFSYMHCEGARGQCPTFNPLTQLVELLHRAAVTLLALGLCILLQCCDRERLFQGEHDLIHLQEKCNIHFISFIISLSSSFTENKNIIDNIMLKGSISSLTYQVKLALNHSFKCCKSWITMFQSKVTNNQVAEMGDFFCQFCMSTVNDLLL